MKRALIIVVSLLLALSISSPAFAASPIPEGLQISPVRDEIKVGAGGKANGSVVVANLTDKTMVVDLQVRTFSVSGLSYDYRFSNPDKPWIHLSETELSLASQKSKTVSYSLLPDAKATPGGYYYSIVASTKSTEGGLPSTLQAVSLLYITINGNLTQSGEITDIKAPKIVFGKQFEVSIDALNTGNVYYFAAVSGQVHGLFTQAPTGTANHLLIPNKVRRVSSAISSPLLPGVYPIEVQYKTDTGTTVHASQLAIFIPPWSIALLIGVLLLLNVLMRRKKAAELPATED